MHARVTCRRVVVMTMGVVVIVAIIWIVYPRHVQFDSYATIAYDGPTSTYTMVTSRDDARTLIETLSIYDSTAILAAPFGEYDLLVSFHYRVTGVSWSPWWNFTDDDYSTREIVTVHLRGDTVPGRIFTYLVKARTIRHIWE